MSRHSIKVQAGDAVTARTMADMLRAGLQAQSLSYRMKLGPFGFAWQPSGAPVQADDEVAVAVEVDCPEVVGQFQRHAPGSPAAISERFPTPAPTPPDQT